MRKINKNINIIYLCTAEKGPSGGGKTIYRHSEFINKYKNNFSSQILHIKKSKQSKWIGSLSKRFKITNQYSGWKSTDISVIKNFRSNWIKNSIKNKNDLNFDKNKDFIIVPEIFAHLAKDFFIKKGISYAIFVQNGYCLESTNDFRTLNECYKKAKFILSYSNDITNCVGLAFPECKNKILRTNISIDLKKFNLKTKKNNLITYMPRKLPQHSEKLLFFLKKKLQRNWKIIPLHNLNEKQVYNQLLKSKIFLSFSEMEGLGMPPIEAAIAGNKVIGYTGQGGKEYWSKPIFSEIPNGNLIKFANSVLECTKVKKNNINFINHRKKLFNKYSTNQEKNKILNMLNKIKFFFE